MYLLDSHVLVWALSDRDRIPRHVQKILADPLVNIWVSSSTIWELYIKNSLGKLDLDEDLVKGVERFGFKKLLVTFEHAKRAGLLPRHHSDPFDRMLVAQAICEKLKLITSDKHLKIYECPILYFE